MFTPDRINRVHLIGVGGTAMAALAAMLQDRGMTVTGSDQVLYPPISDFLAQKGIQVRQFGDANLEEDVDLVVIGNALSRGNDEVEAVLERGIPYRSLPEVLRDWFIQGKRSIVVTGTHGKTTTTSLLAWILFQSGRDPSFFVGGIPKNFSTGYRLGFGLDIVVEGDEYDTAFFDKRPKFLHYMPRLVTLSALEYDHADIYEDIEQLVKAFQAFLRVIPRNGRLIVFADDPLVQQIAGAAPCPTITCSLNGTADWKAEGPRVQSDKVFFRVSHRGKDIGECSWIMPGRHNVVNALLAMAAAVEAGVPAQTAMETLQTFQGVRRRLDFQGTFSEVLIYDDFAHHPTAIQATLSGLRELYPMSKIWAVFEPRSHTVCRRVFQEVLPDAFGPADKTLIGPIHPSRLTRIPRQQLLDLPTLTGDIEARGREAWHLERVSDIVELLKEQVGPGDVVCVMSNGDFGGLTEQLKKSLSP